MASGLRAGWYSLMSGNSPWRRQASRTWSRCSGRSRAVLLIITFLTSVEPAPGEDGCMDALLRVARVFPIRFVSIVSVVSVVSVVSLCYPLHPDAIHTPRHPFQ